MKKILSILLVFTMLFALCACEKETVDESSQIESYPETPAEDFQYTELEDGSGLSVEYYYGGDEVVVIPAEIKGKPVKDVRVSSFRYNEKLKTLYIPEGVTKLSAWLMSNEQPATTTVEKIVLPSTLTHIDNSAFKNFTHLREINLPDSLQKVGNSIFEGCVSLTGTYLPKAVFGNGSLTGCCIESIVVPEGVTELCYAEFAHATVKSVTLPSSLKVIGTGAFYNCPLTEISLPEGLERIEDRAFEKTLIKEAVIPSSVKEVSDYAFNSETFERLIFLGDAPLFFTDWEDAFNEPNISYEIHISKSAKGFSFPRWNGFPVRYTDSSEMPKTSGDFEYFENENGVAISGYLGNGGDVVIPESIDGKAVTEIGIRAFAGNETVKSIKFPATLEKIGNRAFMNCEGLEKLELPSTLKEIGSAAFAGCSALTELNIPQGVETIGSDAFAFNDGIVKVVLSEGVKNWGDHIFQNCNSISDVTLPADMKVLPEAMFFANYALTQLTLPAGLTEIGESALRSTRIESLTLPEGLKIIGDYAFEATGKLKSINIPESLEYIGEEAFESTAITELTLPAGFKTFWGWSFNCCYRLEKLTFLGDAPEVKITSEEDDGYGYSIDYTFPNNTDFTVYINPEAKGFEGGFWDECRIEIIVENEESAKVSK